MEIARQNTQYVPMVEIRNVLFVLSLVLPFFGVFVNYYGMWILMFALGFLWITLTKHEANAGLMFLWGLEFEPAPVDFVFFSSWLKRAIKGDVKWSDNPFFYLLFAYVLINLIQILVIANKAPVVINAPATFGSLKKPAGLPSRP